MSTIVLYILVFLESFCVVFNDGILKLFRELKKKKSPANYIKLETKYELAF